MWILKNSKDLLGYIQSRSLSSCISIKTFYFSTLYRNISHSKLKDRLKELVQLCFINMHSQRIYKDLALRRHKSYFVQNHPDLRFCQNVLWNWYHQIARGSDWCHICYAWWTCFSTDSLHTYGYKLCSSSRRLVPLFVRGRFHTRASHEKRKQASPIL